MVLILDAELLQFLSSGPYLPTQTQWGHKYSVYYQVFSQARQLWKGRMTVCFAESLTSLRPQFGNDASMFVEIGFSNKY